MTRNALLVGLLALGLLLAALATRNGDLALLALPFLTYLTAGLLTAPAREGLRLSATRSLHVVPSGRSSAVEVRLALQNAGRTLLPLRLAEPLQPGASFTGGDLRQEGDAVRGWLALAPGEATQLQYRFEARRGNFRWGNLGVVTGDPFGLYQAELALPAASELQIRPQTQRFRRIALRPASTLHAPGAIPAHLGGSGTDFWGVREYHPGDPLRRLDWRLTARHPRQFFTREFEQEEVADIALILDARRWVDVRIGENSLFEHAVSAAASMAEALLHEGHRVSLLVFGDQMTKVYPGYGKVQLHRILRTLAQIRPGEKDANLSLDYVPLRQFSTRALIVIVSPLAPGDWAIFPRLRAHGNQGLLICPDALDFARESFMQDQVTRLAVRAARVEHRLELRKIAQLNIRVIDWQVDEPLYPLVRNAFRPPRGRPA